MALRMHVARENRTPLRFAHTATSTTNVKLWLIPSQRRALSALDELVRAGPISVRRAWKRWACRARRAGQVRWARSPGVKELQRFVARAFFGAFWLDPGEAEKTCCARSPGVWSWNVS